MRPPLPGVPGKATNWKLSKSFGTFSFSFQLYHPSNKPVNSPLSEVCSGASEKRPERHLKISDRPEKRPKRPESWGERLPELGLKTQD